MGLLREYIHSLLLEGVMDPGTFKAIFLAGGPGSGKSTAVRKFVNVDDVFELLMKKSIDSGDISNMDMQDDDRENRIKKLKMFNKSKALTKKRKENFIQGRLGLVIDGTGGAFSTIKNQKKKLEELGYETFMMYVDTTLEAAMERNIIRGKAGGRRLRDKDVIRSWNAVDKNKLPYESMFGDSIVIIDGGSTNNPLNKEHAKKIKSFLFAPVNNLVAREWIDNEMSKRSRR